LKLYGQELNLIISAIARINMFMHNVDMMKSLPHEITP
jgi:type I restriction-modification system DNA methylase subunit